MKKVYSKPSASVVNVRLFGSVLDNPNPGVGRESIVTDGGDAKANDEIVEEDDDDLSYNALHIDWSTE
jgi:hypothetical protein